MVGFFCFAQLRVNFAHLRVIFAPVRVNLAALRVNFAECRAGFWGIFEVKSKMLRVKAYLGYE